MTDQFFWDFSFFTVMILYSILSFLISYKYYKARLSFSLWLLAFFLLMAVGNGLTFLIYFTAPSIESVTGLPFEIPQAISILAVSFLFSVSLVMFDKTRLTPIPIGIGIVLGLLAISTSVFSELALLEKMFSILGYLILALPTILLFLYLFLKTKSFKSLAFSLGMALQLIGGFFTNFDFNIAGIITICSAIVVFLGITGVFDKAAAYISQRRNPVEEAR